jgi:hypothetical protein
MTDPNERASDQRDQISEWGGFSGIFSIGATSTTALESIALESQRAVTAFPHSQASPPSLREGRGFAPAILVAQRLSKFRCK